MPRAARASHQGVPLQFPRAALPLTTQRSRKIGKEREEEPRTTAHNVPPIRPKAESSRFVPRRLPVLKRTPQAVGPQLQRCPLPPTLLVHASGRTQQRGCLLANPSPIPWVGGQATPESNPCRRRRGIFLSRRYKVSKVHLNPDDARTSWKY